jgi:hypothetical protein
MSLISSPFSVNMPACCVMPPLETPSPGRSEWRSNLPPDYFVSRGSISHMCFVTKVFYGEELLAPRPATWPTLPYFSTLSHNWLDFQKQVTKHTCKMCVLIFGNKLLNIKCVLIFRNTLLNIKCVFIFRNKLLNIKCVFWFSETSY